MRNATRFLWNTILLTATSLLMRLLAMSFQVYLTQRIGPEGIGLFELLMSVYGLAVALAVSSSYRDAVIPDDVVAIGEVGLTGEIRTVSHMNQRLSEAARLGFKKCIIPKFGAEKLVIPEGMTVYKVRNIREAVEVAL